ncbi:PrgH/EprH family type III secretion apparatus protein [Salmonella enterica]
MNSNEKEAISAMMQKNTEQNYTMKVLFGPMFGCELLLPADDYFLIIDPKHALVDKTAELSSAQEHAAHYAQNTLYIPCDIDSPNIVLRLAEYIENDDEAGFRVEIHDQNGSFNTIVKDNEIFIHEHIRLAFKRCEDEWSEEIKNFNYAPSVDAEFTHSEDPQESNTKKKRVIILGSILLLLLIIMASVVWYQKQEYDRRLFTLGEALTGAPAPLEIVASRDNKTIYVLAKNHPEMEWAQEALVKLKENTNVKLLWLPQYGHQLVQVLRNAGYPVLQFDNRLPQHPVFAIYRPLSKDEEAGLNALALQNIPFALDIRTKLKTKVQLLKDARQGLDRLHISYRQINTTAGYALVVRDALNDSTLNNLRHFIKDFKHQWGGSVINFSINLDEDWLQNKSYVDSSDGYLFMNPQHWYFPLKQGDTQHVLY